jgi:pimeloyl-ACP methyl ester carboxylesterase
MSARAPRAACLALAALAGVAVGGPAAARSPRPPGVPLAPCMLAHPTLPARVSARCGTIEVPEDWSRPAGRRIALRAAVIEAEDPQGPPDPVLPLAGGPGQAIVEVYPAIAGAFARLARDRDVVLVDQRGTGGSAPLACEEDLPDPSLEPVSGEAEARKVAACARALSARADLARYRTDDFARDLDRARQVLGYDRVNLVGFSYGSRAALVYARLFPDRVRTLVLDGVAPVDMAVGGTFERDGQRALELLFRRCRADPACAARFPDLDGRLRSLLARLARAPRRVSTRDPLTGAAVEVRVEADALRSVVMAFSYTPESAALLPLAIESAERGDVAALAAQLLYLTRDLRAGMSGPLQLSVVCAEDVPFIAADPPAAAASRYLGTSVQDAFRRLCAGWPVRPVPASWKDPVRSEVPALLLSGEADPVTPPEWAERAARTLPNARAVVLPGQGHGSFSRGCVPRLVARFVEAGSAASLDLSCVERSHPPPIFLDLSGGAP